MTTQETHAKMIERLTQQLQKEFDHEMSGQRALGVQFTGPHIDHDIAIEIIATMGKVVRMASGTPVSEHRIDLKSTYDRLFKLLDENKDAAAKMWGTANDTLS